MSTRRAIVLSGVAVVAALVFTLALQPWIPHTRFAVFYVAVVFAAFLGGFRLAVGATLFALLLVELFVFRGSLYREDPLAVVVRVGMLAALSLIAALLVDRMKRARLAAERKTAEAEELAATLRDQTQQLETQVAESEAMAVELEDVNQQLQVQTDVAERAAERAARLQRISGLLLESTSESVLARLIAREARAAVEADGALVALARDDGTVEVAATEGRGLRGAEVRVVAGRVVAEVVRAGAAAWLPDRAALERQYPALAGADGESSAWAVLPLHAERRRLGGLLFSFAEAGAFAAEDQSFMLLLAQQCAQALERSRLHETTLRARVRAEFAERRLAFLSDASARLSESLDYHATLANVAQLTVPDLADWSLIHLNDETGAPRLVSVVHTDADRAGLRREIEERYPGGGPEQIGLERVLHEHATHHVQRLSDDLLRSIARDDEHYQLLRRLELRSAVTVPIRAADDVCGTITLGSSEAARDFGELDVTLLSELARRAGQAVSNARLYQAAHFASEAKSDFLAVMSHELRTPLNAIIGYTDLLLLGVPNEVPERALRQVERIRSASNSLLQLVEEVLSFSRIEAGKEEIRISPVDLSALLRDAAAMIEPMAAEKKLAVRLELPDTPLKVVSDERKIRQIVTNLLSNAVKFTEQGEIRVGAEAEPAQLLVHVSDTGIGIPQEHLERIFDPFWQVEQSATRRFGGTGLGLGVARKLATLLEGSLSVDSEVGVGSTFTLSLPRRTPGTSRPG